MPIIKSAKKRVRVAKKAASRNSRTKRNLKTAFKAFAAKADPKTHAASQSAVDKAAKKGVIKAKTASRKISRLAKRVAKAK